LRFKAGTFAQVQGWHIWISCSRKTPDEILRLLLLAQPLEEKVRKKHYIVLLKDNLVAGLMELLVVEALTPLL
jgi:hypothetical protein